jgi:CheY-like chemotaxis protein
MNNGKVQVLIAEDEDFIRDLLADVLRIERFDCVTASDGQQALEILRSQRIDVVVSDIVMPNIDGIELLMTVKQEYPHIPVILITGKASMTPEEIVAHGADGFFRKPFHNVELVFTLRSVLRRYTRKVEARRATRYTRSAHIVDTRVPD